MLSFWVLCILHNNYMKLPRAAGTGGQVAVNTKALCQGVGFPCVGFPSGELRRPAADATAPCCSSQTWKASRGEVTGSSMGTGLCSGYLTGGICKRGTNASTSPTFTISGEAGHCHLTEEKETSPRNKTPQNKTQDAPYLGKEMYFIGKKKLHFTYTP